VGDELVDKRRTTSSFAVVGGKESDDEGVDGDGGKRKRKVK
jgi:hypothetical protein